MRKFLRVQNVFLRAKNCFYLCFLDVKTIFNVYKISFYAYKMFCLL